MNLLKAIVPLLAIFTIACTDDPTSDSTPTTPTGAYYVDAESGNDSNDGLSPSTAFATLAKLNTKKLFGGNQILLKRGQRHYGQLKIANVSATLDNQLFVGGYGNGDKPIVDGQGELAAIYIIATNYITIDGLEITADGPRGEPVESDDTITARCSRYGVLFDSVESGAWRGITLRNLDVHDVFYYAKGYVRPSEERQSENQESGECFGHGIVIYHIYDYGATAIEDITIENCNVERVSHTGIKCYGGIKNIKVTGCNAINTGAPGMQFSEVDTGYAAYNKVLGAGAGFDVDTRNKCRASGFWVFGTNDFLVEHSEFRNCRGQNDSAGVHIDYGCKNVVYQYNVSENNAGGFCEILGDNYNCAYRYNISINDGYRTKGVLASDKGETIVGKSNGSIILLSPWSMIYRYDPDNPDAGPFEVYFYNNTIYSNVDNPWISIYRHSRGILMMNNIFYSENDIKASSDEVADGAPVQEPGYYRETFKNNLFVKGKWPEPEISAPFADSDPVDIFDPFSASTVGGNTIEDYKPINSKVKGGIKIPRIEGDNIGLTIPEFDITLEVTKDIMGNTVDPENPGLGAIVYQ
ncbi:MAG: right-handed parallel beta-helix repeat-containing protein [Rikenellaceae bacterium]